MNNKDLKMLLNELGDAQDFGVIDTQVSGRIWDRVQSRSSLVARPQKVSTWSAILRFPTEVTDLVARPLAFTAMLFMMVLGGWITSVNASLESVPGDALYGVKLASERAQLTLATPGTKAKLHGTFAARRVKEVEKLVQEEEGNDELIRTALNGFTKQIDGVNEAFKKSEDDQEIVELARIIEEHTGELEAVLDRPDAEGEGEREVIAETVNENSEVTDEVVEVLVEKSGDSAVSRQELERQYRDALQDVRSRSDLLAMRIDRLEVYANASVTLDMNFKSLRLRQSELSLSESMNFAANSGYDSAFEILDEADAQLRALKEELIGIELDLVAPPEEEGESHQDQGDPHAGQEEQE